MDGYEERQNYHRECQIYHTENCSANQHFMQKSTIDIYGNVQWISIKIQWIGENSVKYLYSRLILTLVHSILVKKKKVNIAISPKDITFFEKKNFVV